MGSIASLSKIPMRAISFLSTLTVCSLKAGGLLPYMPDYAVYPDVKNFSPSRKVIAPRSWKN